MRDSPVAMENTSVESASRRRSARAVPAGSAVAPVSAVSPALGVVIRAPESSPYVVRRAALPHLLCYHRRARPSGRFYAMANIKQQKKRVRTAAEQRLENLRYRSTIKTLTKRLASAAEGGEPEVVEAEHRNLVKLIDRAVARGALHRNAAARKKSQAARLAHPPA